ncbi:hypothetical protein ACEPPZ_18385, partial [Paracoccus yeei]|uniref:hypothetical protein n=1 Tax=Paracoccus yeei TaxID=147645 RepID=UPI0037D0E718
MACREWPDRDEVQKSASGGQVLVIPGQSRDASSRALWLWPQMSGSRAAIRRKVPFIQARQGKERERRMGADADLIVLG